MGHEIGSSLDQIVQMLRPRSYGNAEVIQAQPNVPKLLSRRVVMLLDDEN